jgi:hypothetical protein
MGHPGRFTARTLLNPSEKEALAMKCHPSPIALALGLLIALSNSQGHAQTVQAAPHPAVPLGLSVVATLHAQGAQVYECRVGTDGRLGWQLREPIATLMESGRTVGQHYAGPTWQTANGSDVVLGRVVGRLPGAGAGDIPWLRLEVAERRGVHGGQLTQVAEILRINTSGGVAGGICPTPGALRSVAYAADYLFLAPQRTN